MSPHVLLAHALALPGARDPEANGGKEHLAGEQPARPDWDLQLLYNAGFRDITLDRGVSDRVFANPDKFYNPTPMFIITAEK